MPLVANSDLPTFERLRQEGQTVLSPDRAQRQDIRELHIGLLNMMPDTALAATERQFFRLVGGSNQIAQFYVHPFTLEELPRSPEARAYIARYYTPIERVRAEGLDALIVTGANVTQPDLSAEPFWRPLTETLEWAYERVTSTLCSCLATHVVLQARYGRRRRAMPEKRWGVYAHQVVDRAHPLVSDVNTRFDVPHSRFNDIRKEDFEAAGLAVLVEGETAGVHLAVSEDRFRLVLFQGHPEYDTQSLLKEYKREVKRYWSGALREYPPFPENYFGARARALLDEFRERVDRSRARGDERVPELPEELIIPDLHNTWHDTAKGVVANWIGKVYQVTHQERALPFMAEVDPDDPLGLRRR